MPMAWSSNRPCTLAMTSSGEGKGRNMNRRTRARHRPVLLASRSQKRFPREKTFALRARLSRTITSSFKEEIPKEAPLSSDLCDSSPAEFTALFSSISNGAIQDPRMSFAVFIESKFIPEHVEHKTKSGQRHYQAILKHLLRPETVKRIFHTPCIRNARLNSVPGWPYLDEVRLCDITSDHVRRLLSSACDRGYSPQTIKHIKNVMFAAISHAQRIGCFAGSNPAGEVNPPALTRRALPDLTVDQTKAILSLMQSPDRDIALFCLTTNMTISEICELQWKHVNLGNCALDSDGGCIPPFSIAVRPARNGLAAELHRPGRNRNIEIPEPLLLHLRNLRRQAEGKAQNDCVLISQDGSSIPPERISIARLLPIRRALGLPWLSWQALRRARVSLLEGLRTQLAVQMMGAILNGPIRSTDETAPAA
jgi:integrase